MQGTNRCPPHAARSIKNMDLIQLGFMLIWIIIEKEYYDKHGNCQYHMMTKKKSLFMCLQVVGSIKFDYSYRMMQI